MKKIYQLNTCDTCQKILAEWKAPTSFEIINIKEQNINAADLDFAAKKLGSYEALFSRRAIKFRSEGWNEKNLTEKDFRKLILKEYTFLKRPVLIHGNEVFAGNSKAVVAEAKQSIHAKSGK
jgi:arsenate reductase (glutaredoxin)